MSKLIYGMTYTLSKTEQKLIKDMSEKLNNQDESYFINNYKVDKNMKFYTMCLNGFSAEFAFCKMCGVDFDNGTSSSKNYFNSNDAVLKNGKTIDVKNTTYKNGRLLVRVGKEKKYVDGYALMTGAFPTFTFSGWSSYDNIINPDNIGTLGNYNTKSYMLNQYQLNKELNIE
tara:strand:+ start:41 stop:556 length:516 start_codon:yes stop_codon:yes gene_type:complete